jgi:hypothetical protein
MEELYELPPWTVTLGIEIEMIIMNNRNETALAP